MHDNPQSVCVLGVGAVGQQLVDVFSIRHNVIGYEPSTSRAAALQAHYAANSRVTIQTTTTKFESADLFCIAVPTLTDGSQSIDTSAVAAAVETVSQYTRPGATVVMECSVSVGMTRALLGRLRAQGVFVGFSAHRGDPGRAFPAAEDIAKVVSGIDADSLAAVQALYSTVYSSVVPVSSLETAEMTTLFENCFRMINIAYVNEMADACAQFGICPHEMVSAAATKPYGYTPFWAGAGVGGPSIPATPASLLANNKLPLLREASEAMQARPGDLAARLVEDHPEATSFLVVGAAYKAGEASTSSSPGEAMAAELAALGKRVAVHDPLVRDAGAAPHLSFVLDAEWCPAALDASYDVVVVATAQQGIDFGVLSQLQHAEVVCYARVPGLYQQAEVVYSSEAAGAASPLARADVVSCCGDSDDECCSQWGMDLDDMWRTDSTESELEFLDSCLNCWSLQPEACDAESYAEHVTVTALLQAVHA